MSQLSLGSRHLNPFTEIIWKRGSRRWLGLRKGRYVRLERPAPWLLGIPLPPPLLDPSIGLEMQQHLSDVRQQFTELPQRLSEVPQRLSEAPQQLSGLRHHLTTFIRYHMTAPNLLIMAAVVAGLLLVVLLLRNMLQKQRRKQPQSQEDPEVLARKAASLDQQRSRFRRALGGEDELPAEPSFSAVSTSQDLTVSDRGLDDFDAWDADTQKQWKRFMKSSRSQEIDEEQWWDIDRDELPADRHVYQDFD